MAARSGGRWPVLTSYDQQHLRRIAMPLGGIGTGTVSLGGRGQLQDWEIVNRPAKGFTPANCFFALYARAAGGAAVTRALEGVIPPEDYEGARGCPVANHGLPRFRRCRFAAAYPLGQVMLRDRDVPLDVRIEGFNPLVPGDADASGIPVAVLRFVLSNRTGRRVSASICGSLVNFIGADGSDAATDWAGRRALLAGARGNRVRFRTAGPLRGLYYFSEGVDPAAEQSGTMALVTTARGEVTWRTAWADRPWGGALLDFWDDFSADGRLTGRRGKADAPTGSLAVRTAVAPRGSRTVTFLLTWRFPNRRSWTPAKARAGRCGADRVGNYYATRYRDAWDAAVRTAGRLGDLEGRTVRFVRSFCEADLPGVVKEAALYNLSTLRSQTCFRTADGRFYGWEGCCDRAGCCYGSCTHVWNYEQATAFLFGELAAGMREVEFAHATRDDGHMSFRVNLPLRRARGMGLAAADGQMGCLVKLYRDWRLSGDDAMLRRLWPKARKAMAFCWIPGGWDADADGVMEGCQHNTMDVEYYGPNPQMGTWYLAALRACEEMARRVGDDEFAATCRRLFESGSRWIDENLFNGEYYEHQVRPPGRASAVAEGLRHGTMGPRDLKAPELQLGPGCLVDQLVGQYMAHVCGLGYLLRPANIRKALRSILKYNVREDLGARLNTNRSFAMNDERAILMATYPRSGRPKLPFPYATEVMTGFEYTAAVGMCQEGMTAEGIKCIADVRARYNGRKRNPFNEAECGHHYARAMASWAAVTALTGFRYSGVDGAIEFPATDAASRVFWSNGWAWGTFRQVPARRGVRVELAVLGGRLRLARLVLRGAGAADLGRTRVLPAGRSLRTVVPAP